MGWGRVGSWSPGGCQAGSRRGAWAPEPGEAEDRFLEGRSGAVLADPGEGGLGGRHVAAPLPGTWQVLSKDFPPRAGSGLVVPGTPVP